MLLSELKRHLDSALKAEGVKITKHVDSVQHRGRSGGIEKAFADALHGSFERSRIQAHREKPLREIGLVQRYEGRTRGWSDCYIPKNGAALEYKAVRLNRSQSSPLFDVGQLLADYQRLDNIDVLDFAYLVIFLYGPLVSISRSAGDLYRTFHNQMFVDCTLAAKQREFFSGSPVTELGWDDAWGTATPPVWAAVVKHGPLGAVALSVFEPQ